MLAAFYLLTIAGLVGSYDVLYYHIYKLRLYRQRDAMWENVTHFIRALLFALMMFTVLHVDARGWLWLVYPLLLTFETVNTMTDTILEPRSRRNMGGLPPAEYSLHVFLSIVTGAALASIIWGTYELLSEPAYIGFRTLEVPVYARIGAYSAIAISLGMFTFELVGFCRLYARYKAEPRGTQQPEAALEAVGPRK